MAITLAQLKTFTKQTCDLEQSEFGDEALAYYINSGYQRLYDLLLTTYEGYILNHFDFTLTSGQDGYVLPPELGVLKINGLDFNPDTTYCVSVRNFPWRERNKATTLSAPYYTPYGYPGEFCLNGNKLYFRPTNLPGGNYRCHYVPRLTLLANDADTVLDVLEPWFNYIVVAASIKLLQSEKTDSEVLQTELARIENDIRTFMSNRDEDNPQRVANTRFMARGYWSRGYY